MEGDVGTDRAGEAKGRPERNGLVGSLVGTIGPRPARLIMSDIAKLRGSAAASLAFPAAINLPGSHSAAFVRSSDSGPRQWSDRATTGWTRDLASVQGRSTRVRTDRAFSRRVTGVPVGSNHSSRNVQFTVVQTGKMIQKLRSKSVSSEITFVFWNR